MSCTRLEKLSCLTWGSGVASSQRYSCHQGPEAEPSRGGANFPSRYVAGAQGAPHYTTSVHFRRARYASRDS